MDIFCLKLRYLYKSGLGFIPDHDFRSSLAKMSFSGVNIYLLQVATKSSMTTAKDRTSYNNYNNDKATKFQHIQRKWGGMLSPPPAAPMIVSPGGGLVSETEESDMDGGPATPKSPNKFIITSGSKTVKSLTNRYEDFMGESKGIVGINIILTLTWVISTDRSEVIWLINLCKRD